ncbi:MAG: hypothetical protein CTY20_07870 [Hyphomicrobium sp.]|nr:MAG: hypothetical protein CTY20_07870 [Hyphomicrobium sp.]
MAKTEEALDVALALEFYGLFTSLAEIEQSCQESRELWEECAARVARVLKKRGVVTATPHKFDR